MTKSISERIVDHETLIHHLEVKIERLTLQKKQEELLLAALRQKESVSVVSTILDSKTN